MAVISTNDLKNNMTLKLPDGYFNVIEFQHVKPGKGGAFVRTKLKNMKTGAVLDKTFRADEKVEQAIVEKTEMQYLYRDGNSYVFMNSKDYEQLSVDESILGDATNFLKEGDTINLLMVDSTIMGVDLPTAVSLKVVETENGIQGDRVSAAKKPATLETGLVIQVPLFVNVGDYVKVDTRTGEYLTRA